MLLSMCHTSKGRVIFIGVSVCWFVMLQKAMVGIFILTCVSVCQFHWCVHVAVCPASKCYDMIIHITLCVRVSFSLVCPCGGVSCFKML